MLTVIKRCLNFKFQHWFNVSVIQTKLTQSQITRYVIYYTTRTFLENIRTSNPESLEIEIEKLENLEKLKLEKIKELENLEIVKLEELKRKRIATENLERIEIEKQEMEKRKNTQFNKQIIYYSERNTFTIYLKICFFINKTSKRKKPPRNVFKDVIINK